jgi:hypothetical protein
MAWNRYVEDLARGLANVIAFVNPEVSSTPFVRKSTR